MKKLINISLLAATIVSTAAFAVAPTSISADKKLMNVQFSFLAQAFMSTAPKTVKTSAIYQDGVLTKFERNSVATSSELPKLLTAAAAEATQKGDSRFAWTTGDSNTVKLMKGNNVVETYKVTMTSGTLTFDLLSASTAPRP